MIFVVERSLFQSFSIFKLIGNPKMLSSLTIARMAATLSSMVTVGILFLQRAVSVESIFFIPDCIVAFLLIASAISPQYLAVPFLLFSFGASAGVFLVAASNAIALGHSWVASVLGAVLSVVMLFLLLRNRSSINA